MFCSQCGNRLDAGSLFCANCGAKTVSSTSEPDPSGATVKPVFSAQTKEFFESLQPAGFFESLFDFSFTSLVTTKLIKLLYGFSIAGLAIVSLFWAIVSMNYFGGLLVSAFVAVLFFLFGVCYTRVMLEIVIVVFRIAEHTVEIAQQGRIKEAPAEIKSRSQ